MCSSNNFIALPNAFRSAVYFELVFVYGVRYGLKVILLHVNIQFFQNCLLKRLFFLHLIILKLFYKSVQFCFEFCSVYPHVSSICSYIRMTVFDY